MHSLRVPLWVQNYSSITCGLCNDLQVFALVFDALRKSTASSIHPLPMLPEQTCLDFFIQQHFDPLA